MKSRRHFLKTLGGIGGLLTFSSLADPLFAKDLRDKVDSVAHLSDSQLAQDEEFWSYIQQAFTVNPGIIHLNNGGVSPQPKSVQDAMIRYYQFANEGPSQFMWHVLDKGRENIRKDLARLAGAFPEEIAINRNTTEALATVIFGLNLKKGDEIVLSRQDYPNMRQAWQQREAREGIKLVWIDHEFPSEDEDELVKRYTEKFSTKTKIVQVTHMINWNGQILPAKKITKKAHEKGIEVLLDGAHTFAHIDYNLHDIGCDYFGTSLHKWLCAPFGSGMLYVKKEKIEDLWPLFPGPELKSDKINKFEHLGTRSFPIEHAIGEAIHFHDMVGIKRKEARLRYLKNYWVNKVKDLKGVEVRTPMGEKFSCGIALLAIEGMKPNDIRQELYSKFAIYTTGIDVAGISGARISPHIYTSTIDLDKLVTAIETIAKEASG